MRLIRTTPDPFYGYHDDQPTFGDLSFEFRTDIDDSRRVPRNIVVASFPRYGKGIRNRSDYDVAIQWLDVKMIIEKFCEAGEPQALALREATRLAEAARELGWEAPSSDAPQSN
jgi:hypothetical protein